MKDESGATLVEALAFTVIAIIFVISAVALWNMASNSANAQNVVRQYQAMATDIQDLFQGQDSYGDLDAANGNPLLIESEVVPEDLSVRPTQSPSIVNTYGGAVTVAQADSLAGQTNQRFVITYENVPTEACISVTSTLAGTFNQVGINPNSGGSPNVANDQDANLGGTGPTYNGGLPLSAADAQTECTANAGPDTIEFYSR